MDINLTIPGSPTFDVAGIDISIDFRRNESDAYFFSRGSSVNFGMIGGSLSVTYRVAESGLTFTTVNSGNVYNIPSDEIFRTYRFIYNPANGKGYLLVNGTTVWMNDGPDNRNLYWTGSGNVIVGLLMDGNGANKAIVDNFKVSTVVPTVLPIELITFNAEKNDNKVALSWSTATERNNDYFTIERSQNGTTWEPILNVAGAGNSTARLNYEAIDENPLAGIQYYRLKQTDYDGKNETFEVLSVEMEAAAMSIEMYPNPTTGAFTLNTGAQAAQSIRVLNAMGSVVLEKTNITENRNTLDVTDFNSGTYIVEVIANGQAARSMLVKN